MSKLSRIMLVAVAALKSWVLAIELLTLAFVGFWIGLCGFLPLALVLTGIVIYWSVKAKRVPMISRPIRTSFTILIGLGAAFVAISVGYYLAIGDEQGSWIKLILSVIIFIICLALALYYILSRKKK